MSEISSAKQRSWMKFIQSRYAENWAKLDEPTKIALKQSWWAGYAAAQYLLRNKPRK